MHTVIPGDFIDSPLVDTSKLRGQLEGSRTGTIQLAAELLYVHLLIARAEAVSGAKKREIVETVLAFRADTHGLPKELARVLADPDAFVALRCRALRDPTNANRCCTA